MSFGTEKNHRYIPAHEIAASMSPRRSQSLPFFHAFTGCDTVSGFNLRSKKSAWDTWKAYDEATSTFLALSKAPTEVSDDDLAVLERFTILLYDRTSAESDINKDRQDLFCKKGRQMEALPPTRAALLQHVKRAVYQGGYCWGRMFHTTMNLPSPADWGWCNPPKWTPFWTTLPEASIVSRELIHCACKVGCNPRRCSCRKSGLRCTGLCNPCGGQFFDV